MFKSRKSLPQLKHGSEGCPQCGEHSDLKLALMESILYPLWYPEVFAKVCVKPYRGVMMYGPPGSKTMIVKTLATESKVNFLNIKVPELFPNCVDESENVMRVVFRKARLFAPCILFIDEIEALYLPYNGSNSNMQERMRVQLLTELDECTALHGVILVAATNRSELRSDFFCRLERTIYVGLPDEETRRWIFDIKLRNMPIAEDVNVANLVDLTKDYTGVEIQAICHEAAMKALEKNINAAIVTKEHFKAALATISRRTNWMLFRVRFKRCKENYRHKNVDTSLFLLYNNKRPYKY